MNFTQAKYSQSIVYCSTEGTSLNNSYIMTLPKSLMCSSYAYRVRYFLLIKCICYSKIEKYKFCPRAPTSLNQGNFLPNIPSKEIKIIHRFLQSSICTVKPVPAKFNESLNLPHCQLAGKEAQVHAVGINSLETTYIQFKLP